MTTYCKISNGKLILKGGTEVEIPVIQIQWIELGDDPNNPQIVIKTVAGITVKFCTEPGSKTQVKSMIQEEQLKYFKKG